MPVGSGFSARARGPGLVGGALRRAPAAGADPTLSRAELESRLADIRSRMISYGIFSSPLGKILIARSELGVSLGRYLGSEAAGKSYLAPLCRGGGGGDK